MMVSGSTAKGETSATESRWPTRRALLLRFGFCWIALLVLFERHGGPIGSLPWIGRPLHAWIEHPMDLLAQAIGVHVFHLHGAAVLLHNRATGDTALAWVGALLMIALAMVGGVVWLTLNHTGANDERLLRWFRLGLSLLLGVSLIEYGFLKVFPLQFPAPPLALLNEPVGNSSQTLLFWSLYGLHPAFEMILGWIEVGTGLLLLFRRTAFAGAVAAVAVTVNVAMLDLAFDVPVKLFSLTLVVLAVALLVTDAGRIRVFLLRSTREAPSGVWAPRAKTLHGRRIAFAAEVCFALLVCWQWGSGTWSVYRMKLVAMRDPAPITGEWEMQGQSWMKSPDGSAITTIFFDPNTDMMLRDANGDLWRSRSIYDRNNQKLRILYEAGGMTMFKVDQSNADVLELRPIGPGSQRLAPVLMKRVPLPATYPLMQMQYHWISEFEPLR